MPLWSRYSQRALSRCPGSGVCSSRAPSFLRFRATLVHILGDFIHNGLLVLGTKPAAERRGDLSSLSCSARARVLPLLRPWCFRPTWGAFGG